MLIGIDASRAALARRTGTENYSFQLIRHLVSMDRRNRYRLYFNQPPAPGLFDPAPHVEFRVIPLARLWTHVRLSIEMLQRPPDLLFVPAHVLPVVRPPRTVVTVHDLGYHYYPEAHRPFDRWYLELTTRWHARVAGHVLADSETTRRDLVQTYGADPSRVTVVYPGCDPALRPASDAEVTAVRQRYGIGGDYVLHVGTLQPRKNLGRLLGAFAALKPQSGGGLLLVLAGRPGWGARKLREQAQVLDIGDWVRFLGYVPPEDLPALMTGARVLAMPSLYEGFGLPVVEAMACGTPAVCANRSSLPEVAGDAALLVDPFDVDAWAEALEKALWDPALRAELRRRGFVQARKFTWEEAARRTLEVFQKLR